MKAYIICNDVFWLASPAAIAPNVIYANVAICKLTAWGIHKMYKKHEIYLEGDIICHTLSSPVSP